MRGTWEPQLLGVVVNPVLDTYHETQWTDNRTRFGASTPSVPTPSSKVILRLHSIYCGSAQGHIRKWDSSLGPTTAVVASMCVGHRIMAFFFLMEEAESDVMMTSGSHST